MTRLEEAQPRVLNEGRRRRYSSLESGSVYVGRPTKWGNPFLIGRDGSRGDVVHKYRLWLEDNAELLAALPELRGKSLSCWCAPAACHADVLLEMANKEEP